MYLRTPKRYQPGHKRRHLISTKWLWLWVLTGIVAVAGWQIYERRDQFGPPVREFISNAVDNASGGIATMVAPTPLPTNDPADHIMRGDNAWTQGSIEQAVTEYALAVGGAPNNVQLHYRYTYGLLILRRSAQALAAAENAVTANPFSSDAWAIRALALARNNRYAEAITSGLQALSFDPNNAKALAFMAETYLDANLPAQAQERANQAVAANPDSPEAYFALGRLDAESNFDFVAAMENFEAAYDLAPNLPQNLVEMAWTTWRLAQYGQADYDTGLEQLMSVIETNPNNLDALYALGFYQYQVYGDPNKAEDYLSRCVQVDSSNVSCLNYLATVQIRLGNAQGAAQSYQRIIDAGTTDPRYYLRAGSTYADLGDCRSASSLLRTGYTMELAQSEPSNDRLAAFEQYMSQCGIPFNRVYSEAPQATQEGPLLIPLGGD